jgi:hypothetical protein
MSVLDSEEVLAAAKKVDMKLIVLAVRTSRTLRRP